MSHIQIFLLCISPSALGVLSRSWEKRRFDMVAFFPNLLFTWQTHDSIAVYCILQLSWFLNSHHSNLLLCCFQMYYSLPDLSFHRGGCAFVPLEEVGRGVAHRNRGAEGSLGRKGLMCRCKVSKHWAIQKNSANQMYSMIVSSFSDTGDGLRCPSFLVLVVTNSSSNTSMRCLYQVLSVLHARSMLTGHLWGQCF